MVERFCARGQCISVPGRVSRVKQRDVAKAAAPEKALFGLHLIVELYTQLLHSGRREAASESTPLKLESATGEATGLLCAGDTCTCPRNSRFASRSGTFSSRRAAVQPCKASCRDLRKFWAVPGAASISARSAPGAEPALGASQAAVSFYHAAVFFWNSPWPGFTCP